MNSHVVKCDISLFSHSMHTLIAIDGGTSSIYMLRYVFSDLASSSLNWDPWIISRHENLKRSNQQMWTRHLFGPFFSFGFPFLLAYDIFKSLTEKRLFT